MVAPEAISSEPPHILHLNSAMLISFFIVRVYSSFCAFDIAKWANALSLFISVAELYLSVRGVLFLSQYAFKVSIISFGTVCSVPQYSQLAVE
jgi:hypothetical protein